MLSCVLVAGAIFFNTVEKYSPYVSETLVPMNQTIFERFSYLPYGYRGQGQRDGDFLVLTTPNRRDFVVSLDTKYKNMAVPEIIQDCADQATGKLPNQ